jgi:hypothetical protein
MKTFKRTAIQDWEIADKTGNVLSIERGQEYITSDINLEHVIVFDRYWVEVPVSIFEGEKRFT